MCGASITPSMLKWARERAGRDDYIRKNFPEIESWEQGNTSPSLRDMEKFARATYVPITYLFLDKPPDIRLPVSDFRTVGSAGVSSPSPNMLDTVYMCQQRQDWYREYAESAGEKKLGFVGSMSVEDDVEYSAGQIRRAIKLEREPRLRRGNADMVRRHMIRGAESLGILVMVSGVVGNNTHRGLSVKEFRGFALADAWAPLVFVNGKDSKGAQLFTLAHELAHIWLGQSAVSGNFINDVSNNAIEIWCNAVAAELLVPSVIMRKEYNVNADVPVEAARLAGLFKVSSQVILRRMYDVGGLTRTSFQKEYDMEVHLAAERQKKKKEEMKKAKKSGGNYYNTVLARSGRRFTRAILANTREGKTEPVVLRRLLDVWKTSSLEKLSKKLGVVR